MPSSGPSSSCTRCDTAGKSVQTMESSSSPFVWAIPILHIALFVNEAYCSNVFTQFICNSLLPSSPHTLPPPPHTHTQMPRIWLDYCQFLMDQCKITRTRRTFDRALRALPLTQHNRIWPLYLKFIRMYDLPETAVRVYRRYLKVRQHCLSLDPAATTVSAQSPFSSLFLSFSLSPAPSLPSSILPSFISPFLSSSIPLPPLPPSSCPQRMQRSTLSTSFLSGGWTRLHSN